MRLTTIIILILIKSTGLMTEEVQEKSSYEIQKFTHTPGIYFDKQGQLYQIASTWKIVIKVNLKTLDIRRDQLEEYLENTKKMCDIQGITTKTGKTCNNLYKIVKTRLDRTRQIMNQIYEIHSIIPNRRRGLIDSIGMLTKSLFGTMDANDEKIINEQLQLLENRQETLKHATNQLKILNATVGHLEKSENTIQKNEKTIWDSITQIGDSQTELVSRQHLDEHFILLDAALNNLVQDQNDILTYLNNIKQGYLPIQITLINDIISQIKEAAIRVPQNLHFPFRISTKNWLEIEKFITLNAYYQKGNIFTVLKIPLITYPIYDIINILPLPIYTGNDTFAWTEITYNKIAINKEANSYLVISDNDLQECKKISDHYICGQGNPIYKIQADSPCEVHLFMTLEKTGNCHTKYILANHTVLIALKERNAWLYSTRNEQNIHIQCKNKNYYNKIKNTGIIKFKEQCKLIINEITIQAQGVIEDKIIETYIPEYNITIAKEQIDTINNTIPRLKMKKIIQNPTELTDLSREITQTQKDLENSSNPSIFTNYKHLVYTTAPSGIIIIIIIIIVIFLLRKINKLRYPDIKIQHDLEQKARVSQQRPSVSIIESEISEITPRLPVHYKPSIPTISSLKCRHSIEQP
ncbi:uncharacterized protein LOC116847183 [Odontomachus brunneus]|uniref:uncharacterized protein LOC116847183 n=1 Tax=Odontomachus brunneus TaxID=486640 RepID=UPI0013F2701D|nr:uncharacterized protein LOC116847183 [Odontomachus brunneus]